MSIDLSEHFLLGIIPSFLTILLLLFLISLTIQAGKTRRENQLFTILCLIHLAHHSMIVISNFLPSAVQNLYLFRTVHLTFIFILPVSVHYAHSALNLAHTKKITGILYALTLCLLPFVLTDSYFSIGQETVNNALPSPGPLFFIFLLISWFFLLGYAAKIAIRWFQLSKKAESHLKLKCIFILAGLFPACIFTYGDALPLFGLDFFSVGGFVFIPMGVFTYGVLRHQILDNKGWFSIGYIPNFLTALVWLPLVLSCLFYAITQDRLFYPDIMARLFPMAIPPMISCLVCFMLATFCFRKGSRQIQTMVFGGICGLWGLLNLDIIFLFILKDAHTALQINRFDHFFLVMQVGFCSHFFYYYANFKKWGVYLAYGISLVFVPLSQTPYYLRGMHIYPWGFFASKGILFDILMTITFLEIMLGSVAFLKKIKASATGSIERWQNIFSLSGVLSMAALGLTNIPAMSGINVYPLGTFIFIPALLITYGVFKYDVVKINAYSKKRFWREVSFFLTCGGYLALAVLFYTTVKTQPVQDVTFKTIQFGIPPVISMGVCLFFSVLSLRVGPSLTGASLFGLICMILAFLCGDILLNSIVTHPETGLRISRLNHIFLVMWPALYIHLVCLVCRKKDFTTIVRLSYGAGLLFALFAHSPWYLSGVTDYSWGYFARKGPLFDVFCIFGAAIALYSLWLFHITSRKQTNRVDKQRLKLFSLGLAVTAIFTAGNIPAMSGYDLYPPGNYIFIPITLFGFAMFRKNLNEILFLLNRFLYAAGIIVFLFLVSLVIYIIALPPFTASTFTLKTIFSFFLLWAILFKSYEKIWSAVLALFFGRQKEVLNQAYIRLADQLSKARSLDDIVRDIAGPVFRELYTTQLRLLFYSGNDDRFLVFDTLNPRAAADSMEMSTCWNHLVSIPAVHPLFGLFHQKKTTVTQEQVEAWIMDKNIALAPDDMLRRADIIEPVFSESTLVSLLLFYGKEDGSVYSDIEKDFIARSGFILGPYIENARLLQGLEAEIERRTRDLTSALMVKSDFLSRMSHEIRSPLNAVLGMGELLAETDLNEEQSQYVDILTNSGGLLLSVINDILDFSKIEADRLTVESVPFDLVKLMNDIKGIISAVSIKKELKTNLILSPDVSRFVCGDPFKLSQVILNLADNALRFTEKGEITLHVKNHKDKTGISAVQFCIEDTGIGIHEEKIALIFESFSQAESSTTRRYGGTGLGLTISKKLVNLMGGTISVESDPGQGSRFFFTVPLSAVEDVSQIELIPLGASMLRLKSAYEVSHVEPCEWPEHAGTLTVLLAEDITTNVRVVQHYLKSLPVVLDIAENGVEAISMFQAKPYDLVLMDIHMPKMDGYEALRKIRSLEDENGHLVKPVPVVALTAHVPEDVWKDRMDEFDAFLLKPFSPKNLITTIIRLTHQKKTSEPTKSFSYPVIDADLAEIISELSKEITEKLDVFEAALNMQDYSTLSLLSHGFKGASGNCGLSELSELFKSLYNHAADHNDAKAAVIIHSIRDYISAMP